MIRQLGIDRVHLVAHDFGGPFAAAWAADHPGNVASVTFVNTGVLVGYRWHRMARIWQTPLLGELSMRALNPRLATRLLARQTSPPRARRPPRGAAGPTGSRSTLRGGHFGGAGEDDDGLGA